MFGGSSAGSASFSPHFNYGVSQPSFQPSDHFVGEQKGGDYQPSFHHNNTSSSSAPHQDDQNDEDEAHPGFLDAGSMRKGRWRPTSKEKEMLDSLWARNQYPDRPEKMQLVKTLQTITIDQVSRWFKHKRENLAQKGEFMYKALASKKFAPDEVQVLDNFFKTHAYPSKDQVNGIAEDLGVPPLKVKNWFKSKRCRLAQKGQFEFKPKDLTTDDQNYIAGDDESSDYSSDSRSPAPPFTPSIPSPPTLFLSSPSYPLCPPVASATSTMGNSSVGQSLVSPSILVGTPLSFSSASLSISQTQQTQEIPTNSMTNINIPLNSSLSSVPIPPSTTPNSYTELDIEYANMRRKQKVQLDSHNLSNQIRQRETHRAKPGTTSLQSRKFYLNVVPDKTVFNIDVPFCIIKKFTSDGEKLLCFSRDLKEIQLYRFLGSSPRYQKATTKTQKKQIDKNFDTYFRLIYQSVIPSFNEYLCKDFSLTTTCGKYFILSSYGQPSTGASTEPEKTFIRQPQSNSINLPNPEDISFYLVRIQDGVVCDKRTFKKDVIQLSHHSGVYLYQDFFIVLSLEYQTIHIFQIKGSNFVNIRSIGPHCNEDDQLAIDLQEDAERPYLAAMAEKKKRMESLASITPMMKNPNALVSENPRKALSLYYSLFPQYCNLVMWKMQSLDASHLLIKFGPIDALLGLRVTDYCNQICFFVVYNMHTTEVIGMYENSNKEFAKTFEQFCEHFRACSCPSGLIKFRSTCSNNIFVREHLMKQKLAVVNARYGGETQAVKRILSALPFSPQSWNESPYFDKYLFSYDEKIISSTERPKPLVDYPIKFYSRVSGEVKFKLNTGTQDKNDRQSKKYATYIFHPYCPFIISLQHSSTTTSVIANFHFKDIIIIFNHHHNDNYHNDNHYHN
eukprot:gene17954-21420_t